MIYVLSAIVLLSPLLGALLLVSDLSAQAKLWIGLGGVAFLVIIPIVVFLTYGGIGGLS